MAKNKKKTMVEAMNTAKREAMKVSGFLDGRFQTRTHEPTTKQINRRDRRNSRKNLNNDI